MPRWTNTRTTNHWRSWWCKRTATGRHADPLGEPIRRLGCIEVVTVLGSKHVSHSATEKLSCTPKSGVFKRCLQEMLRMKYLMAVHQHPECRARAWTDEVDSTACSGTMFPSWSWTIEAQASTYNASLET